VSYRRIKVMLRHSTVLLQLHRLCIVTWNGKMIMNVEQQEVVAYFRAPSPNSSHTLRQETKNIPVDVPNNLAVIRTDYLAFTILLP